ncbi:UDP-N-acetylglucosamine pyrophosphorylase, putative [Bodo saltans]|uniref:UDP-N-acetylglucosamine diphosphorylase n=1 Tax=Bodo saltans TaxID=75058 RepID=A0A0S4IVW9_BODSA|nr:UDP-N-acetylglucosamine pyrophosphorylase, putative [Bodo saltans]|eukprot:CUG04160.1 UDP-N-acetylglucosamine pyrophosphorylase, putative [Bodo saltans]
MSLKSDLVALLTPSGQQHIVDNFDALGHDEQQSLSEQVREVAPVLEHYNRIFVASMAALNPSGNSSSDVEPPHDADVAHFTEASFAADSTRASVANAMRHDGLASIAAGAVAVLVLAGGSGTRLGQTFPKGMLVCPDLLQQKSLFQLHCEKILRLEKIAGCTDTIPLLLMTSPQTDKATRAFFKEHHYFGMSERNVIFFVQSAMPCYTRDGKILMETPSRIASAPGGNGGIYEALQKSGALGEICSRGVKYVQVVTVDNMLVKLGDPLMVGYAIAEKADVVVKSTPKVSDKEAVGVFARRLGKWGVVEYTEIGDVRAAARRDDGARLYDAANIAIHLLHVDFLHRAAEEMRTYEYYHAALKNIPTHTGSVAGVKLEAFIFDIFEFASQFRILQVDRSSEFSPIKNADDATQTKPDTPFTAVRDLHALHTKWVRASTNANSTATFEVCPSVSYDGEGLEGAVIAGAVSEAAQSGAGIVLIKPPSNL